MFTVLRYDLKEGTKRNWIVFLLTYLFVIICLLSLYRIVELKISIGKLSATPGLYDDILYIFGGIKPLDEQEMNDFSIPFIWMAIQLLVSSCVTLYPTKDLHGRGTSVLMQYGTRSRWWISKCIWALSQIIILYMIIYLGIITAYIIAGKDTVFFHQEISIVLAGVEIQNTALIVPYAVLFPFMNSIAAVLIQINLSLFMGPVISLMAITAYQILSTYLFSSFLLGNYAMLYRLNNIVTSGVNPYIGLLVEMILSVIGVIAGTMYFKNYDIIEHSH